MAYTAVPDDLSGATWLSTSEASAATGIPVTTLHWWARTGTGTVRHRKIGGRWVWNRADLAALVSE